MNEPALRASAEEIERLANIAGLPLTPAWRDDLVEGSAFALWAKDRLRRLDAERCADADGTQACPPKR